MSELNGYQEHQLRRIGYYLTLAQNLAEQVLEGSGERWASMDEIREMAQASESDESLVVEVPSPEQQALDVVVGAVTDEYFHMAAASACASTSNGWVWYCDEHDTHGNADSQEEAEFMADFHQEYFRLQDPHGNDNDWVPECALYVSFAHSHDQDVESES